MTRRKCLATRAWRALTRHQDWNIGIVEAPASAFVDPAFVPEIRWLPDPPSGRFVADPFVFVFSGCSYILYEDFGFASERGHLAAVRVTEDGATTCGPVLSASTHLAYPFVFDWNGQTYCVPETAQTGEIALYRLDRIPGSLERVGTLLSGVRAVDPTIFEHDGRWWLWFTDQTAGPNEALYLHYADTPLGPWTPHAANPVKLDIASSRPAGTPFVHEGVLYRPAQDCSSTYGGRIALNRVTVLTTERFSEEVARWIEPQANGPRPHGLHTISSAGGITVIDGKRERFIPAAARAAIVRNLRSLVARCRSGRTGHAPAQHGTTDAMGGA